MDWLNLNTDMVAIVPVEQELPHRLRHIRPPHPQGMGIALTRHLFPGKIWRRTTHVRCIDASMHRGGWRSVKVGRAGPGRWSPYPAVPPEGGGGCSMPRVLLWKVRKSEGGPPNP